MGHNNNIETTAERERKVNGRRGKDFFLGEKTTFHNDVNNLVKSWNFCHSSHLHKKKKKKKLEAKKKKKIGEYLEIRGTFLSEGNS